MATHEIQPNINDRSSLPKTNVLGIIFFLFGAPHIYGALKQGLVVPERFTTARYVMVALIAGAIASIIEFSVLTHA